MPSTKLHAQGRPTPRQRKSRRQPLGDQHFSSYLSFGRPASALMIFFLVTYCLLLLVLSPLLHQTAPLVTPTHRGQVLRPVIETTLHSLHADTALDVVAAVQHKIHDFRQKGGVTDAVLLKKAADALAITRKERQVHAAKLQAVLPNPLPALPGKRPGVMVLGMHRSGTSMLAGLLVIGMGYKTGGPLIGGAFDNPKGFFELIPAVLQNDEFMAHQKIWWAVNVVAYDPDRALKDKERGAVTFQQGKKALAIYNNPDYVPYLQKDPRMCITLRSWLPLLNDEPAILFTYRHPLEVADSLQRREQNFSLAQGLRLWIVYNMRAVQNSAGLCRVVTSNEAVLANPRQEVVRIAQELTNRCGVPAPAKQVTDEDVEKFMDPTLQHHKKEKDAQQQARAILATHGTDCVVREYDSKDKADTPAGQREHKLYLTAMKIYCDLESGLAYKEDYAWPEMS